MKRYLFSMSALSLATAIVLVGSGCSGGGSDGSGTTTTTTNTTAATSISVSGGAVDGYLAYATVCLDLSLDGYCQLGDEPATSTDTSGQYSLTITPEQQANVNFAAAPLLVYGGYDVDTMADFTGKLKASFGGEATTANITPLTTMVKAMVDAQMTKAEAETAVKTMLNLPAGTNLDDDPVEAAKIDPALLVAALQIQKSLEVLSNALVSSGSTESKNNLMEGLYTDLANKLKTTTTLTLDAAIGEVVNNNGTTKFDNTTKSNVTTSATLINNEVQTLIGSVAVTNTATIANKIHAVKNDIDTKVSNNTTLTANESFAAITSKTFSLLHAEEILRMSGVANGATAAQIQAVLIAAGMSETAFLPLADEIVALKADAITNSVGVAFETQTTAKVTQATNVETFSTAITLPFTVPMTIYNVYEDFYNSNTPTLGYSMHTLHPNNVFEEVQKHFDSLTGAFVQSNSNRWLSLQNGVWTTYNPSAYTLSTDKTELSVDTTTVKIIKKIDLAAPTAADAAIITELNRIIPSTNAVAFSAGAEAYLFGFKEAAYYDLDPVAMQRWSNTAGTLSTYPDLQTFVDVQGASGLGGNRYSYLAMNMPAGGVTIAAGANGTISEYSQGNQTTPSVITRANAGTWEVRTIPGTTDLALFIKPYKGYWDYKTDETFYVVYNGAVHQGSYFYATTSFDVAQSLEFNKIAFDDIVRTLIP